MAKKTVASAPVLSEQDAAEIAEIEAKAFPRQLTIKNNTPKRLVFSAFKLDLIGNVKVPAKGESTEGTFTVASEDELVRFMTDVETLASIHGWTDPVTITDVTPVASTEPTAATTAAATAASAAAEAQAAAVTAEAAAAAAAEAAKTAATEATTETK